LTFGIYLPWEKVRTAEENSKWRIWFLEELDEVFLLILKGWAGMFLTQ
jgi:hypothetical protein